MAPEQFEGKDATVASDIYALGIVIYEMVTGTRPFVADSALSAAVKRLTELPVAPRAHVPGLEPRWEQTILRCLEREPATRFTSAGASVSCTGRLDAAHGNHGARGASCAGAVRCRQPAREAPSRDDSC